MFDKALEILNIIEENHFEAYIIGGFSRDLYLGINSNDIDICTSATKDDLEKLFLIKHYNAYGVTIISYDDSLFEITTFREESDYMNCRIPTKIKFIKSLEKDLERRDFTINTLCIDKTGNYIDILNAMDDIDKKIIKVVGNTFFKIEEDALRILRAIRFATTLNFKLDNELIKAISIYKDNINKLSKNKIKEEINKILNSNNKELGIKLLKEFDLEQYLYLK